MGAAGLSLEEYFEEQLKFLYQDRSFPGGREEGMIPPVEDEMEEGMEDDGMAPNEGDMPPVEDDLTPVEEGMTSMEKEGTEEGMDPVEGELEEEGIPPLEESMEEEETSPVKEDSPPCDATEPVDPSTRGASSPNLSSKEAPQPLSDTPDNPPCEEEAPQPLSDTPDNPPDSQGTSPADSQGTSPAAGLATENEGTTEVRDKAEEE